MKTKTKAQAQADWYAKFTEALITHHPELSGRIDWDAAKYYFLYGTPVLEAVDLYCIARGIEP
jgi:hypothetical protein